MPAYLYSSWNLGRIGPIALQLVDDDGTETVRLTTGTFAHVNLSSVVTGVTAFASGLQTALNVGPRAGKYSVTWAVATGYTVGYTGSASAVSFSAVTATEGVRMRRILGFSGNFSAFPAVSDVRPFYVLDLARDGLSGFSRDFEVSGQTQRQVSVKGNAFTVSPLTHERRFKGRTRFMPRARVFASEATTAVPWTFEHLLQHARCREALLLDMPGDRIVYRSVNGEFDEASRKPVFGDFHGLWDLAIEGQVLGRL
jgi:hypothetical protein